MQNSTTVISRESTPVDTWLFMSSYKPLLVLFGVYLFAVLKLVPLFMRDRKPFKLLSFMRCYNVFQVIACMFFIEWSIQRGVTYRSTWKCTENKVDPWEVVELSQKMWYFMMLRLVELVETLIFVLRKKQNQVSALHIYHHTSTVALLWIFLKFSPSEMGIFICGLNSLVHEVMYTYYFLSSYKQLRGYVKHVKPLITIIQLAQLGLIFGHSLVALQPSCPASKLFILPAANGLILIGFFTKFYYDSYARKSKKEIKKA